MRDTFTVTYEACSMNNEPGFAYEIRSRGKLLAEGWSRGRRYHAEKQARAEIIGIEQAA